MSKIKTTKFLKKYNKFSDSDDDDTPGYDMTYLLDGSNNQYSRVSQITSNSKPQFIETFERRIKPSDSIMNLSLKYDCKVSLLKKVNNLYNDREFHALKVIKIPYTKHGHISEVFAHEIEGGLSPSPTDSLIDISSTLISSRLQNLEESDCAALPEASQQFFYKMDKDIQQNILKSTRKSSSGSRDDSISFQSNQKSKDSGIHWCTMVMLIMCIAVLTPCLFLLYFEYMPWRVHIPSIAEINVAHPRNTNHT